LAQGQAVLAFKGRGAVDVVLDDVAFAPLALVQALAQRVPVTAAAPVAAPVAKKKGRA
jgi:hypothetical protein